MSMFSNIDELIVIVFITTPIKKEFLKSFKEILLSFIEANQDLLNAEGLTSAGGLIKNNTTATLLMWEL